MKVYLAGRRSGVAEWNRPEFEAAATALREQGHTVVTPLELGGAAEGMEGPVRDIPEVVYLRGLECCVAGMTAAQVEAIVVLPGWESSRGAAFEVHIGHELGKAILRYPTLEPLLERHPSSARFHAILRELGTLHDRKQHDYGRGDDPFANVRGSSAWGIPEWVGAMIRASDKVRRLETFARRGSLANEGAVDSFMDLAVYAVIAMVLYEEASAEAGAE